MTSSDSSQVSVPSDNRGQPAAGDELTLLQTEMLHDFQAQGSAKHLERLASARELGDYEVTLQVRCLDQIAHGSLSADC